MSGEMGMRKGAILFLGDKKAPDDRSFSPSADVAKLLEKALRKLFVGGGNNKYYLNVFPIFAKMTIIRSRTSTFWPGQTSIAPPILVG